jgi:malate dehydrogenase (quinone)
MSVPHLDLRLVDGEPSLLFGPYAGFSPKFLKTGSLLDLFASIRWHNLIPMLAAGLSNLGLVRYLVGQLAASQQTKFGALQDFFPNADPDDWYSITAGQRVQVIKKDTAKGGILQFGTEVVAAADGSVAGLLGASPGASTSVPIMLDLLAKCFPEKMPEWTPALTAIVPTYGQKLADDPTLIATTMASTATTLGLPR